MMKLLNLMGLLLFSFVLAGCSKDKIIEVNNQEQAKIDLKASAKAKLVAGEPLTEAAADTLVL